MRITKRACDELAKTKPEGRPIYWDDQLPGFGVQHNSQGRLSFLLKYRVKWDKRQRMFTLGQWPALHPEKAREEAGRIKAAASLGQDLVNERRVKAAEAITAEDLLDEWRQTQPATPYGRLMLSLEQRVIRPGLKGHTTATVGLRRLQALVDSEPTHGQAKDVRAALARFCKWANTRFALLNLDLEWPTRFQVSQKKPPSRSRKYTLDDIAAIWAVAPPVVRWMIVTGCRRNEARLMEIGHYHLGDKQLGSYWEQPEDLTKNQKMHRVPLTSLAEEVLRSSKQRDDSNLVFPGRGGKPIGNWTKVAARLPLGEGVLHDFRRTIVSTLGDHGFDPQVADSLLNHSAGATLGGVMGVYQRSDLWEKRREAMDLWTRLLSERLRANASAGGGLPGADGVPGSPGEADDRAAAVSDNAGRRQVNVRRNLQSHTAAPGRRRVRRSDPALSDE